VNLLTFTEKGIYCPPGLFYIDPWQGVDRAIITHAHSDHARPGSRSYLCHTLTKPLIQLRLGANHYQTVEWGESVFLNGVKVSLHPAGHMIGSSQVRVEFQGEIWVASGDYKLEDDGISGKFEPVPCHVFITESTFGLPIYSWKPQRQIFQQIQEWVRHNQATGQHSVLIAYSLGKAQRLLPCLAQMDAPVYLHGAIANAQEALQQAGVRLPSARRIDASLNRDSWKEAVVIAPPGADHTPWVNQFAPISVGICSGWMQVRGNRRRSNADGAFALSDHADWQGLLEAVRATGANKVFVTHGFQSSFSRFLQETGLDSAEVQTAYGDQPEAFEEPSPAAGATE
jgi:putative mRNA 3-end processing factor